MKVRKNQINLQNKMEKEGQLSLEDFKGIISFGSPEETAEEVNEDFKDADQSLDETEDIFKVPTSEEEPTKEKEDVVEQETKFTTPTETVSEYSNVVKSLIKLGEWEDAEIELENGEKVLLSEKEDLTEEEYQEIVENQKAIKEEQLKEKYIAVDKVAEDKKRIISIIAKGGDINEIFKNPDDMIRPFSSELGWDLSDERHLEEIVFQQYRKQGFKDDRARALVEADKKDFELEDKAKSIVEFYQKNYDTYLENIEKKQEQDKIQEEENRKKYKQELHKIYKESNLPDNQIKKQIELATRENERGVLVIDEIYEEVMKDPKQAADLIFFLTDREKYLQQKTLSVKAETQKENFRTIKFLKDKPKKQEDTSNNLNSGLMFEVPTK